MLRTIATLLWITFAIVQPAHADSPLRARDGAFPDVRVAEPLRELEARAVRPGDHFKECERCPEMVVVPAGEFLMGSPPGEGTPDEGPQHVVRFAWPFAVGRFAVTFDEWAACVADRACRDVPADDRGRRPVTGVLWDEAKAYVAWLSRKTNRSYRLLSEAEREYVARAGTTTPFWWGATVTPAQANYDRGDDYRPIAMAAPGTLPVDAFAANPWGLYQVHGNVYEWVEDCAHDDYAGAPVDGSAWTDADCTRHVLRGGAYSRRAPALRAAARIWFGAPTRMHYMSLRVARSLH